MKKEIRKKIIEIIKKHSVNIKGVSVGITSKDETVFDSRDVWPNGTPITCESGIDNPFTAQHTLWTAKPPESGI